MLKNGKQVFVVAVRYNPQLGDYLTEGELAPIVSVGKNTFRVKVKNWDGSMKLVTYCICGGRHIRKESDRSVYGSMSRFAFDDFLGQKRKGYAGHENRQKTCDAYIALVNSGLE